jgi:hypothetical protein
MTRPVHAMRWEGSRHDHRLSETCPCQPVAHYDIAEPATVVYVHRSRTVVGGPVSRAMVRRPPR